MNKRKLAPIVVIVSGLSLAFLILITGSEVKQQSPETIPPLVRTMVAARTSLQLSVSTHGTVVPRTESELIPEVSGRVIWVSPSLVSGGFFSEGDPLLRIETLDYEVAVEQGRARLARAESDLANARVAHARQMDLAKHQASSEANRDNATNRLRVTEAATREAVASLGKAKRDLLRTEISAPYDGRVRSERVDVGQFVNRGSAMGTIYAVDFVEVRLPVHDEELAFLNVEMFNQRENLTNLAPVILRARFAGREHEWHGTVVRTEGELDPRTRMVNVVARVADPYSDTHNRPPLSVGLFVDAEIIGAMVSDVVVIPRAALRGKDQVMVVDVDERLRYRQVEVLRLDRNEVLIQSGIRNGERVCISAIETAMDGMLVRVRDDMPAVAASASLDNPS